MKAYPLDICLAIAGKREQRFLHRVQDEPPAIIKLLPGSRANSGAKRLKGKKRLPAG